MIAEVLGLPDHEESWIDDQVYLHRSDDEAIANYSTARRLQEARPGHRARAQMSRHERGRWTGLIAEVLQKQFP